MHMRHKRGCKLLWCTAQRGQPRNSVGSFSSVGYKYQQPEINSTLSQPLHSSKSLILHRNLHVYLYVYLYKCKSICAVLPSTIGFTCGPVKEETHSSVLAWRIPGTGEPGGLLSMGSHRVRHDWSDLAVTYEGRRLWLHFSGTKEYYTLGLSWSLHFIIFTFRPCSSWQAGNSISWC